MRRTGPCSTARPAYITSIWSHILATIPRSWVTNTMATPVSRWSALRRSRYWAWMVTSRLVVGSSAMITLGSPDRAMAPAMRWRMPPLIWWGYSRMRSSGEGIRTDSSSDRTRSRSARPLTPRWW